MRAIYHPFLSVSLRHRRFTPEDAGLRKDMEPTQVRGTKVCSPGLGYMTNMAATTIYGKTLQKSSSLEPKGLGLWYIPLMTPAHHDVFK